MSERIGFTIWSDRISGAEKRFIRIAHGMLMQPRPYDYYLIINAELNEVARGSKELSAFLDEITAKNRLVIVPEPKGIYKAAGALKQLWFNMQFLKVVRKHGLTAVHAVIKSINWTFLSLQLGRKVKIIYELTSPDRVDTFLSGPIKHFSSKFTAIHCVSPSVNKRLLKLLQENGKEAVYKDKIFTAPITFFNFPAADNDTKKENLVVFASRFIERKNPILFANAVKIFLKQNPSWKAAILGGGPLDAQIKELVKEEVAAGSIYVGFTKDIYSYFQRSRILVSVIFPDNYPSQSVLEAMYMKNALVCTRVGDTGKFLKEGQNGLFVNFEVAEVADALTELANNEDKLNSMGQESLKVVGRDFSPDVYFNNLIEVHKTVL